MRGNRHGWLPLWMACTAFAVASCTHSYTDAERARIATAYAETLMAHHLHATDSIRMHKAADSIAGAFGFSDERDLRETIAALTEQPEDLRRMLDTVDRYLQRISAAAPPTSTTIPDTARRAHDTQSRRFNVPPIPSRTNPYRTKK